MKTNQLQAPVDLINEYCRVGKWQCNELDPESLRFMGFHVLPAFIETQTVHQLLKKFESNEGLTPIAHHPTRVSCDKHWLDLLLEQDAYINLLKSGVFFDGDVAADLPYIFRKNSEANSRVHLHNDLDYQMGAHDRYSLFLALTEANPSNGGLRLYPSTHHFGSLGDCGELNPDVLPAGYPMVETAMSPGDLLIMHSGIWHSSGVSQTDEPRIYLELHIKPSICPTAKFPLFGAPTGLFQNHCSTDDLFSSSRQQKLQKFYRAASSDG